MKAINRFIDRSNDPTGGTVRIEAVANVPKPSSRPELEILARDEMQRIEDAAHNNRDALISGSGRTPASGWVSQRERDLVENSRQRYIRVRGKTGSRQVPILPALDRQLPRYIDRCGRRTLMATGSSSRGGRVPGQATMKRSQSPRFSRWSALADRAGIKRRVHPQLSWHSAATFMLRRRNRFARGGADHRPHVIADDPEGLPPPQRH
jgi:hypothetical protein